MNADLSKKANITVKIDFKMSEDTGAIALQYEVKSKVSPLKPKQVLLMPDQLQDENGVISTVLKELTPVAAGQLDLDGNINTPSVVVYGAPQPKAIGVEIIEGGQK